MAFVFPPIIHFYQLLLCRYAYSMKVQLSTHRLSIAHIPQILLLLLLLLFGVEFIIMLIAQVWEVLQFIYMSECFAGKINRIETKRKNARTIFIAFILVYNSKFDLSRCTRFIHVVNVKSKLHYYLFCSFSSWVEHECRHEKPLNAGATRAGAHEKMQSKRGECETIDFTKCDTSKFDAKYLNGNLIYI